MVGLVNCKNEKDPLKNEGTRVVTIFPIISQVVFLQTLKGSYLISPWSVLPNFEPIEDVMVVFVTCKNKEAF